MLSHKGPEEKHTHACWFCFLQPQNCPPLRSLAHPALPPPSLWREERRGVLMWSIGETSVWKCFLLRTEGGEICKLLLPHGSILIVMRPARASSAPGELPRASQARHVPTGTTRPAPAQPGSLQTPGAAAAARPGRSAQRTPAAAPAGSCKRARQARALSHPPTRIHTHGTGLPWNSGEEPARLQAARAAPPSPGWRASRVASVAASRAGARAEIGAGGGRRRSPLSGRPRPRLFSRLLLSGLSYWGTHARPL
ncbi:Hypothetical predicted protein [Podarcis lilfordi]|uniref:Uncharacterized protein n=1 Tax=Podarcis lilfordi TaxID=74358 RepID=A0AA35JQR5_9SAUR|nr:Hypothetical predicted protein [Podarcis lilfordi]